MEERRCRRKEWDGVTGSGGSSKRRNEIHVALRWKQRGGKERERERRQEEVRKEKEKEKERGGERERTRRGRQESHSGQRTSPDAERGLYVPTLAMLLAYVRRYVSTWRSLPTVHPLSRCCFRGVLHRKQRRPRCIYAPRVERLAAEGLSSSPSLPPPDPSSRSSASSSPPPLAPPGLPSSVPLPPRRPYRVACRVGERIRSRLHYLLLNNRRLDSPSIRVSSPFRRPICGPLLAYPTAYIVWTPKTDPSCLSYQASLVADLIIRKDISKHVILLGRLRITRGSLSQRISLWCEAARRPGGVEDTVESSWDWCPRVFRWFSEFDSCYEAGRGCLMPREVAPASLMHCRITWS